MSEPEEAVPLPPNLPVLACPPDRLRASAPAEGRGTRRKPPRWTIPFLRALERTGNARASAEEAGGDHTTAYLRRRTHPDVASDWEWVLKAYAERVEREKEAEMERFSSVPPPP